MICITTPTEYMNYRKTKGALLVNFEGELTIPRDVQMPHSRRYMESVKHQRNLLQEEGKYRYTNQKQTNHIYDPDYKFKEIIQKQINSVKHFLRTQHEIIQ
jgi:hypothetical protein